MAPFPMRVGFLGCPVRTLREWSRADVARLVGLGFNTVQLNVAWGSRPGGEALNLEDLVELPAELASATPMLGDQSEETRAWRREELRRRIALSREAGLRTVFHFGAPYVGDRYIGDAPGNCLLDGVTVERCLVLLRRFASDFPGVDDILVYTYDQHAWLCSEFGPCPRCVGKPLHERVVPFLESLAAEWRRFSPEGRLWWEPWELSAGQVLRCVAEVEPEGFGLALHANIAEVMATFAGDRWLRNTVALARERGIPALAEYWLGSPTEELEPWTRIACPLVTLRGLRSLATIEELAGVKEYYGLLPDQPDPNLEATALFLAEPDITEDDALGRLAAAWGEAGPLLRETWRRTGEAMELFPWEATWLIRALGRSDPAHPTSAALVRGVPWHTPSWASTRRSTFMVVDTADPADPWLLEDIGLRCGLAAERLERAALACEGALGVAPPALRQYLASSLGELREFRRRALCYALHARESNLATAMREEIRLHGAVSGRSVREMADLLTADGANRGTPLSEELALLASDPSEFTRRYFTVEPDTVSRGWTSMMSR